MPGPNLTGLPSSNDYLLGRGIVYLSFLDEATNKPIAWRDVGNAPSFTLTVESETLPHQSSRQGLRQTDKEVTLSQSTNYSFTLDEVNHENLSLFFSGEKASVSNPAVAGFSGVTLTSSLELAHWYDILDANGNRVFDIAKANLTLTRDPSGTPVVLTEGVAGTGDYIVDEEFGRVFFHATPNTGSLVNGDEIEVDLAADAGAVANVDTVNGLTKSSQVVAIKFISENPASGNAREEYQIQQTTISAEGDFALISEEYTTMGFSGATERNDAFPVGQQFLKITTVPSA